MGLVTRQIGPNAKGSKLTFAEMDNNLYYLQGLGVSAVTFSSSTLTLTNPTGGTLSVNLAADTNTFITAATYNQSTNTVILTDNTNTNFNAYINAVSGLTVNGILSATTISGGTLYGDGSNLTGISTQDTFVTGGTYSNGTAIFTNNTGGTFNVNGFYTGETSYVNSLTTGVGLSADTTTGDITIINTDPDQTVVLNNGTNINVTGTYPNFTIDVTGLTDFNTFTTGFTYSSNTFTISDNSGNTFDAAFTEVTGLTVNGDLNITGTTYSNVISATTYQNLPITTDVFVTGGTYSAGTSTFTNNTGGTFSVSGFVTGDTYVTGLTFDTGNYNLTIGRNDGVSFTDSLAILASDLTVTGGTYNPNNGTATFTNNTGGTFNVTGFLTGLTDTFVTGGTYNSNNGTATFTNTSGGTFNVSGFTQPFTGGTVTGGTIFTAGLSGQSLNISGNSSSDLLRVTQTGSGNVMVVEDSGNPDSSPFIITNNGNVGIGITSPSTKLHVSQGMSIFDTLATGTQTISKFTNSNGANIRVGYQSTSIPIITYENFGLRFGTTFFDDNAIGNTTLVLTSGSSVGIGGVINPTENLHVSGNTLITGSLTANTVSATTFYGNGSNLTGINTQDTFLTGGTYNSSIGVATFTNNTGGTFSVTGFSTAYTYSQVNNYTSTVPITITHNLNTTEILIQIIDTNTNQLILGSVSNYQLNSVDITLSSSLNGIKVVIVGGSISSVTPRGKINLLFGHDSVSPVDSTTYYIGGQFNLSPTTSASDGRRLISPVTGFITQVSISETVGGTLGSSETSTFTINNVTQSTSSTITTTATYDSSSSLINYILSSPLYVVNGDKLEIRWVTPAWVTNPTTVRQQINVLIDF